MATQRVYLITEVSENPTRRLVKATSQAQALSYIIRNRITVKIPTRAEFTEAVERGTIIEPAVQKDPQA